MRVGPIWWFLDGHFFSWIVVLWFPWWLLEIKWHHQKNPNATTADLTLREPFCSYIMPRTFCVSCCGYGERAECGALFWSECLNGCCRLGWGWAAFSNGREKQLPNPLSKVGVPSEFLASCQWLSLDGFDSFVHTRVHSTFSSPFGATVWVSLLAWNANVKMYLSPTDKKQEKIF